ncbi:ribosome maturation factor RimP [Sediminitomix flava]|nr:ribosome maturation factor RimP [Sediminitomix flava]
MELVNRIKEIVESHLEDESLFIVDIQVSGTSKPRVLILMDGDNGISIDQCARLSRKVGYQIEEDNVIEDAYILEVSSAGIGEPLMMMRQYKKNVGRKITVYFKDESEKTGELIDVNEEEIVLSEEVKEKGKRTKNLPPVAFPFSSIEKAIIQVSFK